MHTHFVLYYLFTRIQTRQLLLHLCMHMLLCFQILSQIFCLQMS